MDADTTQYIDIDNNFHLEKITWMGAEHIGKLTFKTISCLWKQSLLSLLLQLILKKGLFQRWAGHPSLQSSKIQRIPGLKNIQCAEEIYRMAWSQTIGYAIPNKVRNRLYFHA